MTPLWTPQTVPAQPLCAGIAALEAMIIDSIDELRRRLARERALASLFRPMPTPITLLLPHLDARQNWLLEQHINRLRMECGCRTGQIVMVSSAAVSIPAVLTAAARVGSLWEGSAVGLCAFVTSIVLGLFAKTIVILRSKRLLRRMADKLGAGATIPGSSQ